ncbi:MAG: transposase domain-containing protein [Rhodobacteraceae bacterium]|nr:transposase domain-containing protein [Paracoccaceae bacterium]
MGHGPKNWAFTSSKGGTKALAFTLLETVKRNGVDPQAWLASMLGRIADQKINGLAELRPWRCGVPGA